MRVATGQTGQADQFQQLVDPLAFALTPFEAEGHVASDAQVREEGALLGDVTDASPLRGHPLVTGVVDDLRTQSNLTFIGSLEAGDDAQERGLPAARGPENGREGTVAAPPGRCRATPA